MRANYDSTAAAAAAAAVKQRTAVLFFIKGQSSGRHASLNDTWTMLAILKWYPLTAAAAAAAAAAAFPLAHSIPAPGQGQAVHCRPQVLDRAELRDGCHAGAAVLCANGIPLRPKLWLQRRCCGHV
jgi:hypothetical protein